MSIAIPQPQYIPHPQGQHRGRIKAVEDKGLVDSKFGKKHKVAVVIESETAHLEDGKPFTVGKWFTLSSHPKSGLREFRETLLGRKLTQTEAENLDPASLEGRRVGYLVTHNEGRDGDPFANITNVWPLDGAPATPAPPRPPAPAPATLSTPPASGDTLPDTPEMAMAAVLSRARTNKAATREFVIKKLAEKSKDPIDATLDDWRELWPSVRDDVPF